MTTRWAPPTRWTTTRRRTRARASAANRPDASRPRLDALRWLPHARARALRGGARDAPGAAAAPLCLWCRAAASSAAVAPARAPRARASLIVYPAAILPQWEAELARHAPPARLPLRRRARGAARVAPRRARRRGRDRERAPPARRRCCAASMTSCSARTTRLSRTCTTRGRGHGRARASQRYRPLPTPLDLAGWSCVRRHGQDADGSRRRDRQGRWHGRAPARRAPLGGLGHARRPRPRRRAQPRALPARGAVRRPRVVQGARRARRQPAPPPSPGSTPSRALFWRSTKSRVAAQLRIPAQRGGSQLDLSTLERYFYSRTQERCKDEVDKLLEARRKAAATAGGDGSTDLIATLSGRAARCCGCARRRITRSRRRLRRGRRRPPRRRRAATARGRGGGRRAGRRARRRRGAPGRGQLATMGEINERLLAGARAVGEEHRKRLSRSMAIAAVARLRATLADPPAAARPRLPRLAAATRGALDLARARRSAVTETSRPRAATTRRDRARHRKTNTRRARGRDGRAPRAVRSSRRRDRRRGLRGVRGHAARRGGWRRARVRWARATARRGAHDRRRGSRGRAST